MGNADRLRLIAESTAVASFIPSLAEVLLEAATELDGLWMVEQKMRHELDELAAEIEELHRKI